MKYRKILLGIILLAGFLFSRLYQLGAFVTLDEPFWLSVGANYYYALGQRELQNTVYEYHPAVTTMWEVTAAFLVDFPEYRALDQGYFDVDKEKFDPFLVDHGRSPMHLLVLSRVFQVLLIAIAALFIYDYLCLLFDDLKAFFITAFLSFSPYFWGHSRVLSHEAMVAFFVLASLLGLMVFFERGQNKFHLFISAAFAALAQVTKSSAMAMFPVVAVILAVSVYEYRGHGFKTILTQRLKTLGLWLVQLALVYFIIWPGMWVAPGKMLTEVYGNAFNYAFLGSRTVVVDELQLSQNKLGDFLTSFQNFSTNILYRATVPAWIGVILFIAILFIRKKNPDPLTNRLGFYAFLNTILFIILFSLAQGRDSPHYIMASHVSVDLIAALGLLAVFDHFWANKKNFLYAALFMTLAWQVISNFSFAPYYYTYYNPVMSAIAGKPAPSDYGEGLEKAADFLATQPDAENKTAYVFRARGPFSYFFPGKTVILNPFFTEEKGMPQMLERMEDSDYLVINEAFGQRAYGSKRFFNALKPFTPIAVIKTKGVSTIYIYSIADLPEVFYKRIAK